MAEIISLSVGNIDAFKKAMGEAGDSIEAQAKVIARFQKEAKDGGIPVELVYDVKNKGKGTVREIRAGLTDLQRKEREFQRDLAKRTSVEKRSLTASRQRLAQARQELNSLNQNTAAYARQQKRVETLTRALQFRQGIQGGSVAALKAERNELLNYGANTELVGNARDELNRKLAESSEALRRAQGIEKGSIADLKARRAEVQALSDQYAIGSRRQQEYARELSLINRQLQQNIPTFQRLITSLNQIATIQAGFTAISSFAGQVNGLINQFTGRIKQVENFRLAIQNVGFSISETSAFFNEAADTALRLGAPVTQVEQAYRRMIPALQGAGISSQESTQFIEALSARTQTLGLSADQSGRLVEAFAQVLSKGKLQAEELNQQISEADGAFRTQFAEALGITIERLSELTRQGQITSKEFVTGVIAMQNGVDTLAAKVANGNLTIQQLQNTIATINTKAIEAIGTSIEPAIRAILNITLEFQKFIGLVVQSPFGKLIAQAFNESLEGIQAFVKSLITVASVLGQVLTPIANLLRLLQQNILGIGSITSALVYLAGVLITVRVATALLTKSLAITAALAGGQFVSSWGAAGAALLGFASIAKSIFTLNFAGFGLKATKTLSSLAVAFGAASGGASRFQVTLKALTQALKVSNGSFTLFAKTFVEISSDLIGSAGSAKITSSAYREVGQEAATAAARSGAFARSTSAVGNGVSRLRNGLASLVPYLTGKIPISLAFGSLNKIIGAVTRSAGFLVKGLFGVIFAFGKIAVPIFLVTSAIQILTNVFKTYGDVNDAIGKKTDELSQKLKIQGGIVKQNTGIWQRFSRFLKTVFVDLGGIVPFFERVALNKAIVGDLKQLEQVINRVNKALEENGLKFAQNGSLVQFNADKTSDSIVKINATIDTLEAQIAATEELIAKKKEERGVNDKQVKDLEKTRNVLIEQLAYYKLLENRIDAKNVSIEEAIDGETEFEKKLTAGTKAIELRNKALEKDATKAKQQVQDLFIQGLITEGQVSRANAELEAVTAASRVRDTKEYLRKLEQIGRQRLTLVERAKLESEIEKNLNKLTADKAALTESIANLRETNIALIEEEIGKANQLIGIYDTVRDAASNVSGQLGSTISSAVDAVKEGISQAARLEFSVTLDSSALIRAANTRQRLGALEFKLEAIKIQTEKIIQVSTLRRIAAEQKLLAAKLRAEGDQSGALLAEQAAAAIERQIPALSAAYDLQGQIVGLQERGYKAEVNRKRELLGLPALFENTIAPTVTEWENVGYAVEGLTDKYRESAQVAQAAAQNGADGYDNATQRIQQSAESRLQLEQQLIRDLVEINKQFAGDLREILQRIGEVEIKAPPVNSEEFEENLEKTKTIAEKITTDVFSLFDGSASGNIGKWLDEFTSTSRWDRFREGINNVVTSIGNLFTEWSKGVNNAPRFDPFGSSNNGFARWMGGPVAAGQTYTVNDGGGREGFVDQFNNFKMLPAGRNIKWTPTTSGTVIPAHLVDQFRQNMLASKVNTASSVAPRSANAARVNASLDSGNLVKQIGSVMAGSGGNQRITNNVTIQSQSPVMDASVLMANVSRLRNRRRGGL